MPVGGDSGLLDVAQKAMSQGQPLRDCPSGKVEKADIWPAYVDRVLSLVDVSKIRPLKVVIDAANGMAGAMLPPVLERLPIEVVRVLLRAGRNLPEPRAEPTAPREPRVHRREDARGRRRPRRCLRRRRRPLLLLRRHGRVRPRRLRHRAPGRGRPREGARREDHLRRPRELGRPGDDRARRRGAARQPGRPRLHQGADARGRCGVRRRGIRPLLLPRVHAGGHRRRAVSGAFAGNFPVRGQALGAPAPLPRPLLPHRRAEHAGRRRPGQASRAGGTLRAGGRGRPSRRPLGHGRATGTSTSARRTRSPSSASTSRRARRS